MTDEFDDYLATAMKDPEFRSAFERARHRPRWRQWLIDTWARRPSLVLAAVTPRAKRPRDRRP